MIIRDITEHRRAEKALRQANQLLETIFEHTHLMVAYFDPQFNFLRVNHAYAKAEGREPAFFPGKNYFALYPDAENEAIFRRVEETGQPYFAFAKPFEFAEHVERGVTYWDWSLVPIKNPEGATTGLILTLPNVTERLVADQSLRESESKLKAIFENTPIGIAMFDAQGELDEANVELEKITRSSREELLAGGFKKLKLIRLDGSEMLLSEFVKKCAQPENQLEPGVEIGIVTADNQVTWTLVSATQLGPSDNRVVIIMQDITERRQAEELINRAAHEWQATFDATNDAIWILNQDHRILRTNKAATRFFQRGTDQLIGKHCWEIIHNTTQPLPECPMQRALNSFSRETMELQIGENWFQIVVDPIIDKDGRCYSTVHIVRDITESKRVQEELLAKTNKLHGLAAHLQSVREEERTAIAREIHDEFGQVLSALKMNLSIIEREVKKSYPPATPEKILNELDISKEIIGQAVKKVRRLITELRPEVLDIHGLMPALHWQCDEFSFRTKIKCVFKSNVETIEFTEARSIDVFRILQEALNNVAQHAQATKVSVNILKQQNEMVLNIKDNGIGFDVKILDKKLTFGLLGMQERTLLCAGKMEVKSKKGKGTEIEIRIPLGNS